MSEKRKRQPFLHAGVEAKQVTKAGAYVRRVRVVADRGAYVDVVAISGPLAGVQYVSPTQNLVVCRPVSHSTA